MLVNSRIKPGFKVVPYAETALLQEKSQWIIPTGSFTYHSSLIGTNVPKDSWKI
jgi:hypothetical protein